MDHFGKIILAATAGAGLAVGGTAFALTAPPLTSLSSALPSLSTPASANVHTPTVATPHVATPVIATPGEGVQVGMASIALPTQIGAGTSGSLTRAVATPSSTPTVGREIGVPTVEVRSISVPSVTVGSIPVSVALPMGAQASGSGASAAAAGGFVSAQSNAESASRDTTVQAGSSSASVHLGR